MKAGISSSAIRFCASPSLPESSRITPCIVFIVATRSSIMRRQGLAGSAEDDGPPSRRSQILIIVSCFERRVQELSPGFRPNLKVSGQYLDEGGQ